MARIIKLRIVSEGRWGPDGLLHTARCPRSRGPWVEAGSVYVLRGEAPGRCPHCLPHVALMLEEPSIGDLPMPVGPSVLSRR